MDARTRRTAVGAGLALVAIVVLGFALNAAVRMPCRDVCGSDLGRLYEDRGIDRGHIPYFDRDLEYPPLIGAVMYGAGSVFDAGLRGRFLVNAALLCGLAALTTWLLWRRYGSAARRWAFAPPLYVSGLTNWDLLAVAPATIALLQWEAGNAFVAGVLIGAGSSAKLFPLLFVPMLVASCFAKRDWRSFRALAAGVIIGVAVFAGAVYAVAPDALRHFLRFHSIRGPSRGSFWYYPFRGPSMELWLPRNIMVDVVNAVTATLVIASIAVLAACVARRRLTWLGACALAVSAFVVTNKIYSPQYDLWIVPFLVMLPVRTRLVVHFYISSVLAFLMVATEGHIVGRPLSLYFAAAAVLYRLVVHVFIALDFWRCGSAADSSITAPVQRSAAPVSP
jgi:hypothetical protein